MHKRRHPHSGARLGAQLLRRAAPPDLEASRHAWSVRCRGSAAGTALGSQHADKFLFGATL